MRRRALRLLISLILGVVLTVAIAWHAALRAVSAEYSAITLLIDPLSVQDKRDLWVLRETRSGLDVFHLGTTERTGNNAIAPAWQFHPSPILGTAIWALQPEDQADILDAFDHYPRSRGMPKPTGDRTGPEWPSWLPDIPESEHGLAGFGGRAAGWPILTMRSLLTVDAQSRKPNWRGALRLRPAKDYFYAQPRLNIQDPEIGTVPLLPIPVPFATSTAAIAAPIFLLLTVPPALRRHLRRRRGHCLRCGYDLKANYAAPCPECGHAAPAKPRVGAPTS
jgi:hypothetical protein